jgi:hypothetical protein
VFVELDIPRAHDAQDEGAVEASGCGRESLLEAAAAEAEAVVQRVFQEELGVAVPLEVDALQPSGPMGALDSAPSSALSSLRECH